MAGLCRSASWLANTFAWTTDSDPAWEMYIHNKFNKVKPNIRGSGVSSLCATGSWWIAKAPCNEPWHKASIFQDYSIVVCMCVCVCVYTSFAALYPSCHLHSIFPAALQRPATVQYCVYMCTYVCLHVPAKLVQHLERISVPLFCSHCLGQAKREQVQGSTGSRFIFPFISILTLLCNHPHSLLIPNAWTNYKRNGRWGKPRDTVDYIVKNRLRRIFVLVYCHLFLSTFFFLYNLLDCWQDSINSHKSCVTARFTGRRISSLVARQSWHNISITLPHRQEQPTLTVAQIRMSHITGTKSKHLFGFGLGWQEKWCPTSGSGSPWLNSFLKVEWSKICWRIPLWRMCKEAYWSNAP